MDNSGDMKTMPWPTHIVAAAGYVFDTAGNILIVKTYHRGWDCPGGQIEEGETIEEGLLREIYEESGIRARAVSLCGIYSNVGKHPSYNGTFTVPTKVMLDFLCEYESGTPRTSDETAEVRFVPGSNVLEYITSPAQAYRFSKALAFSGNITYAAYVSKPEFRLISERTV